MATGLSPADRKRLTEIYESSGGLRDFNVIRTVLHDTCSQTLNDGDLEALLLGCGYRQGYCMKLDEFLAVFAKLKERHEAEVLNCGARDAFLALGGEFRSDNGREGEVSTARLKAAITEFELSLDFDALVAEVDTDSSGQLDFTEFAKLLEPSKDTTEGSDGPGAGLRESNLTVLRESVQQQLQQQLGASFQEHALRRLGQLTTPADITTSPLRSRCATTVKSAATPSAFQQQLLPRHYSIETTTSMHRPEEDDETTELPGDEDDEVVPFRLPSSLQPLPTPPLPPPPDSSGPTSLCTAPASSVEPTPRSTESLRERRVLEEEARKQEEELRARVAKRERRQGFLRRLHESVEKRRFEKRKPPSPPPPPGSPSNCLPRYGAGPVTLRCVAAPLPPLPPRPKSTPPRKHLLPLWVQGGILKGNIVTSVCTKRRLPQCKWVS